MLPKNLLEEFNKVSINTVVKDQNDKVNPVKINTEEDNKTNFPKNKCTVCKKKTGLTGFGCVCGGNFCGSHRHADQHQCKCTEQMIQERREILAKNNQKVVADKVIKI